MCFTARLASFRRCLRNLIRSFAGCDGPRFFSKPSCCISTFSALIALFREVTTILASFGSIPML
jgi:hypothetical protein